VPSEPAGTRFAERVFHGVGEVGTREEIVIWIERRQGALWAVGRAIDPKNRAIPVARARQRIAVIYEAAATPCPHLARRCPATNRNRASIGDPEHVARLQPDLLALRIVQHGALRHRNLRAIGSPDDIEARAQIDDAIVAELYGKRMGCVMTDGE